MVKRKPKDEMGLDAPGPKTKLESEAALTKAKTLPTEEELTAAMKPERRRLPDERRSLTHKFSIMTPHGERKFYLTCGMYEDGRLGEIFLTEGKEGSTTHAYLDSLATSISIGLQYGVPLTAYTEKMLNMQFEPAGMLMARCHDLKHIDGKPVRQAKSPLDYAARFLELRFPNGVLKEEKK